MVILLRLIEGVIGFSGFPEMVKQDSQFSGNRDDSSLFGVLAAAFSKLKPPATQVAVRTEGAQDIVSGVDQ